MKTIPSLSSRAFVPHKSPVESRKYFNGDAIDPNLVGDPIASALQFIRSSLEQYNSPDSGIVDSIFSIFDVIFGPAYKGIPLASAVGISYFEKTGNKADLVFDRKEAKDHGEGGSLIGALPKGNVLIIDDVVSSGLAIREAQAFLKNYDVNIAGALVTLDRQEQGQNSKLMASSELINEGLDVLSLISLDDLLDADEMIDESVLQSIRNYRDEFRGENV